MVIRVVRCLFHAQCPITRQTHSAHHRIPNIMLESGGRVYAYGSQSTLGKNFRLNKCMGYLNENYKIAPSCLNECPRIDSGRLALLSGKCQDFVRSMNTCATPKPDDFNRISGFGEDECRVLINKQNHISCYNDNYNSANFFF